MATVKKKPKLALPPTILPSNEKAMQAMIEKGGSVISDKNGLSEDDKLKSFTFKIYESELSKIREIQSRMPKRDRISIHDFVLAAVKDKIKKQY